MTVTITYFVHGTTTDNEQHLATGQAPGELSKLGIQQAKDLPGLVKDKSFTTIFCSDLKRSTDSAELGFSDYPIKIDKRLRECDYGDLTQKPHTFKDNMMFYVDNPFPNGESYQDVENRIRDFLDFLKANYDCQHIAIVAHEAPQLALEVICNNRTWQQSIDENWRKTKDWKPGWTYTYK